MSTKLTPDGYTQTRAKLENLERRLADLESRTDLKPPHLEDVRRSYKNVIRQYRRESALYEEESSQEANRG
jgi:hypothetical protein